MAHDIIFTAAITPNVKAAADLRTYQHKVVVFDSGGVKAASVATSGHLWVLGNKPNSGETCTLYSTPNVVKIMTNAAVGYNTFVTLSNTGTVVSVGSRSTGTVGVALTSVASGSLVDVALL